MLDSSHFSSLFICSFIPQILEACYFPGTMFDTRFTERTAQEVCPWCCHITSAHLLILTDLTVILVFFLCFILSSVSLSLPLWHIHQTFLSVGHLTTFGAFLGLMVFLCWAVNISSSILNSNILLYQLIRRLGKPELIYFQCTFK